jgi:serine/threonine protein kinase
MNANQSPCNPDAIEQLLADGLNDEEHSALEEHLGGCPACRDRLESAAAEANWWQRARQCLAAGESTVGHGPDVHPLSGTETGNEGLLFGLEGRLAPSDDPRMLGRLAGYEIAGVIGCGGMGIVLKGLDTALGRYVAIKVLSPQFAASAAPRQRFAREAKAAASVVHDNVMAIHGVGEASGLPYLVMPYVRGPSLEKRLERTGPLAIEEVLRIGMQIAAGLAAAHAQGLVHRDIKPANILLEEGVERVKITDFGLARAVDDASLSRSGVIAGTPQYMSPEQARGESVDCRSDLFSLGSVLYAMCTGRPPFRAETPYGVLRRINEDKPRSVREVNPAIPAWLAHIIEELHQKEPSKRFQSAAEIAELLERCLAHVQQPTSTPLPAVLSASATHAQDLLSTPQHA